MKTSILSVMTLCLFSHDLHAELEQKKSTISISGPESVIIGDAFIIRVTITNNGLKPLVFWRKSLYEQLVVKENKQNIVGKKIKLLKFRIPDISDFIEIAPGKSINYDLQYKWHVHEEKSGVIDKESFYSIEGKSYAFHLQRRAVGDFSCRRKGKVMNIKKAFPSSTWMGSKNFVSNSIEVDFKNK